MSFYVWIDTPTNSNCMTGSDFNTDTQREDGFKSGEAASAIRVNTALRQANLIAVALVNALGIDDSSLDAKTSLASMKSTFENLNLFKLSSVITAGTSETTLNKNIIPLNNYIKIGSSELPFDEIHGVDIFADNEIHASKFVGSFQGSVTGGVTGNVKGNVTGNVTGLLKGQIDNANEAITFTANDPDGNGIAFEASASITEPGLYLITARYAEYDGGQPDITTIRTFCDIIAITSISVDASGIAWQYSTDSTFPASRIHSLYYGNTHTLTIRFSNQYGNYGIHTKSNPHVYAYNLAKLKQW